MVTLSGSYNTVSSAASSVSTSVLAEQMDEPTSVTSTHRIENHIFDPITTLIQQPCMYPILYYHTLLLAVNDFSLAILVSSSMNTDSPSTGIGANTPFLLRYPPNSSLGSSLGREVMFENLPYPVCFFSIGSFEWETFVTACHLLVGNHCGGLVLHSVDPRVSYTIGELLLLSP